jgi:hypothetical protein
MRWGGWRRFGECENKSRAVPGPVVALLGMMAQHRQALETAMLTDGGKPIDAQGIGVHILEVKQP